jgi:hypothetical protein
LLLGGRLAITIEFHDCVQWIATFTNEPNVALSGVVIERRRRSCNQGGCLLDVVIRPLVSQIKSDIGQIVLRQYLSCQLLFNCLPAHRRRLGNGMVTAKDVQERLQLELAATDVRVDDIAG